MHPTHQPPVTLSFPFTPPIAPPQRPQRTFAREERGIYVPLLRPLGEGERNPSIDAQGGTIARQYLAQAEAGGNAVGAGREVEERSTGSQGLLDGICGWMGMGGRQGGLGN